MSGGKPHCAAMVRVWKATVWRAVVSISISACSATLTAFASGVTVSGMPRAVSASTSTAS